MTDHKRPIEEQVAAWADDLAARVEPWDSVPTSALDAPREVRPRRLLALGAAAFLVAAAVAVIQSRQDVRDPAVSGEDIEQVRVRYERVTYSQQASVTCNGPDQDTKAIHDEATFEAWADTHGKQFRNRVTYPDGSARDVIAIDSPWYPTSLFTRGAVLGRQLGCGQPGGGLIGAAEPGQSAFFSLNPLAQRPNSGPDGAPTGERPAVPLYSDEGTRVEGEFRDSAGRPVELWRQVITGYASVPDREALTQTTEWFVDGTSNVILERTFRVDFERSGSVQSRLTLKEFDERNAERSLFDYSGFDEVELR